MMNIIELNLTELREDELIETEGGILPLVAYCIVSEVVTCIAIGVLAGMVIN